MLNEEHANRFPHEFPGPAAAIGIARALTMDPSFIICDDPQRPGQYPNGLNFHECAGDDYYLFISHDLSMVRHISDNIAVMYLGSIVEYAGNLEIYNNPLHPYTKALFSAIPVPNPRIERERNIIMLEGDVPTPINTSSGCKFAARCPVAEDVGKGETPGQERTRPFQACHRLRQS